MRVIDWPHADVRIDGVVAYPDVRVVIENGSASIYEGEVLARVKVGATTRRIPGSDVVRVHSDPGNDWTVTRRSNGVHADCGC